MTQADEKAHLFLTLDEIRTRVGSELGVSEWLRIDQAQIDAFADATGDRQFIHVDPERAARETPFGGTIAHGFLTLSLLPCLAMGVRPRIEGTAMSVNYGFDKIRFLTPVACGACIRARFHLDALEEQRPREVTMRYGVTVEIEGEPKPALAAEWITRAYLS
ncbi:MAG: MaoC family dehydratase [Methyloligellaceae bacterium]